MRKRGFEGGPGWGGQEREGEGRLQGPWWSSREWAGAAGAVGRVGGMRACGMGVGIQQEGVGRTDGSERWVHSPGARPLAPGPGVASPGGRTSQAACRRTALWRTTRLRGRAAGGGVVVQGTLSTLETSAMARITSTIPKHSPTRARALFQQTAPYPRHSSMRSNHPHPLVGRRILCYWDLLGSGT